MKRVLLFIACASLGIGRAQASSYYDSENIEKTVPELQKRIDQFLASQCEPDPKMGKQEPEAYTNTEFKNFSPTIAQWREKKEKIKKALKEAENAARSGMGQQTQASDKLKALQNAAKIINADRSGIESAASGTIQSADASALSFHQCLVELDNAARFDAKRLVEDTTKIAPDPFCSVAKKVLSEERVTKELLSEILKIAKDCDSQIKNSVAISADAGNIAKTAKQLGDTTPAPKSDKTTPQKTTSEPKDKGTASEDDGKGGGGAGMGGLAGMAGAIPALLEALKKKDKDKKDPKLEEAAAILAGACNANDPSSPSPDKCKVDFPNEASASPAVEKSSGVCKCMCVDMNGDPYACNASVAGGTPEVKSADGMSMAAVVPGSTDALANNGGTTTSSLSTGGGGGGGPNDGGPNSLRPLTGGYGLPSGWEQENIEEEVTTAGAVAASAATEAIKRALAGGKPTVKVSAPKVDCKLPKNLNHPDCRLANDKLLQ